MDWGFWPCGHTLSPAVKWLILKAWGYDDVWVLGTEPSSTTCLYHLDLQKEKLWEEWPLSCGQVIGRRPRGGDSTLGLCCVPTKQDWEVPEQLLSQAQDTALWGDGLRPAEFATPGAQTFLSSAPAQVSHGAWRWEERQVFSLSVAW